MKNTPPSIARLGQVAISVHDLDRAVGFYRDVLGLKHLFTAPPGLAFFDAGNVRLMLEVPGDAQTISNSILYFAVPDIESAYASTRSRVEFVDEPHLIASLPDHDLYMVFFMDSEGNLLAYMEERKR